MGFVDRLRFHCLKNALRRGWDVKRDGQTLDCSSEAQARKTVAYARANGWLLTHASKISDLTKTTFQSQSAM
jgi:hypothetical protein